MNCCMMALLPRTLTLTMPLMLTLAMSTRTLCLRTATTTLLPALRRQLLCVRPGTAARH